MHASHYLNKSPFLYGVQVLTAKWHRLAILSQDRGLLLKNRNLTETLNQLKKLHPYTSKSKKLFPPWKTREEALKLFYSSKIFSNEAPIALTRPPDLVQIDQKVQALLGRRL